MSLRDLLVISVVLASLPVAVYRPHIGVLVWSWLGFMNPHRLTWGLARSLPLAQGVAISTMIGCLLTGRWKRPPLTAETFLLLLFTIWMQVTTLFALNQESAWFQWDKVWKIQLMIWVTMAVLQSVDKVRNFVWVVALSIGFYGIKGGVFTVLTGGAYQVLGPDGTFISGNTEIGLALLMVIPLFRYLQLTTRNWWVRMGLLAAIVLCSFSVIGTHSRGAFLGGVALLLFLIMKSRKRIVLTMAMAIAIPTILSIMPQTWYDKMHTIETYEEDGSAMGRINAWTFAFNLARARPIVGGGFETFTPELFRIYAPDPTRAPDAHSIYFEVLGEHGFPGLVLFLMLGLATWRGCNRIRRAVEESDGLAHFGDLARMIQVSLVGYAVSGAFLGLAYFDLYYALVAMVAISRRLVVAELALEGSDLETSGNEFLSRRLASSGGGRSPDAHLAG